MNSAIFMWTGVSTPYFETRFSFVQRGHLSLRVPYSYVYLSVPAVHMIYYCSVLSVQLRTGGVACSERFSVRLCYGCTLWTTTAPLSSEHTLQRVCTHLIISATRAGTVPLLCTIFIFFFLSCISGLSIKDEAVSSVPRCSFVSVIRLTSRLHSFIFSLRLLSSVQPNLVQAFQLHRQ